MTDVTMRRPLGAQRPFGARVAVAMSHPSRIAILKALESGPASQKALAERAGLPLEQVVHHVRHLAAAGCIEVVESRARRGGSQAVYAPTERDWLDAASRDALERAAARSRVHHTLRELYEELTHAASAGVFEADDDYHLHRYPLLLDEHGREELDRCLDAFAERIDEIVGAAVKRRASGHLEPERAAHVAFMRAFANGSR